MGPYFSSKPVFMPNALISQSWLGKNCVVFLMRGVLDRQLIFLAITRFRPGVPIHEGITIVLCLGVTG